MSAPAQKTTDADPEETREWLDALEAVVKRHVNARGVFLLSQLEEQARQLDILTHAVPYSSYRNTRRAWISRPCIRATSVSRGAHHGHPALERVGNGGTCESGLR